MEFLETIGSFVLAALVAALFGAVVAGFSRRLASLLPESIRARFPLGVFAVVGVLAFIWMLQADRADRFLASSEAAKLATTLWGVILAVAVSGAVFVAANLLFNQARNSYASFSALLGAVIGFVVFGLLDGNRLIQHVNGRDGLAEALHDVVNANEWTLLLFSLLIAGLLGVGLGSAVGVVRENPERYRIGGLVVGLIGGFLWGLFFAERIPVDTAIALIWTPLLGAILVGALGYLLAQLDQPVRLAAGVLGGAVIGLTLGGLAFTSIVPRIELLSAIVWPIALAVVGGAISRLRGQDPIGGAIVGALVGWIIGVFVVTNTGGPRLEAFSAFGVAGALAGARFSYRPRPTSNQLTGIENRARSWIFVSPALFFVGIGLVASLIRSVMLSFEQTFRDDAGQRVREFPSLENYRTIFGNETNLELTNWRALFTSAPFEIGMVLVAIALGAGLFLSRRSGNSFRGARFLVPVIGVAMLASAWYQFRLISDDGAEAALAQGLLAQEAAGAPAWRYLYLILFLAVGVGLLAVVATGGRLAGLGGGDGATFDLAGGHGGAFAFGLFLVVTAIFAAFRGTVINSIWWVFMVTVLATAFGLAIAALADRAKMENVAKSIIFMPLAISFVGAGIIWRFMYIARPGDDAQTGLLNWAWVALGDLSLSGSRWIVVAVLALLLVGLAWLGYRGFQSGAYGLLGGSLMLGLPLLWVVWRLAAGRLGGTGAEGVGERTVIFISQNLPYNNLWLMVVLIWIQTGFAMVIFSAAIKAVPQEYIEAAKVDGATDSSIFWRIIVPSIVPTIGVVVTTLMVSVLKIFDVVKVMTNGNFETQIIANEMIFQAFTVGDRGLGSALAIVLFLAVLPVLYMNVRRLQQEGA
ncbi:MAG: sugar ABC transporter permease [Actinomycetota bacterium]